MFPADRFPILLRDQLETSRKEVIIRFMQKVNPGRDLEELVAKIQKQLAPESDVIHDVMLDGRLSKRKRQIDVLVKQNVGQYEIQIIIDCKDYKRPVDVKGVEEFYGLLCDVGAQKGVLVCPIGFSEAAKTRAEGLQVDLYSPVDTDAHKWQAKPGINALCDFRSAGMSFRVQTNAPLPFTMRQGFFEDNIIYDKENNILGTILDTAINKWNEGRFPTEPGVHEDLPIFETAEVLTDNGHGMNAPVILLVSLHVERELFFGQFPITNISGFKDELSGGLITNAFTVGLLSPEEVEQNWLKISQEDEAPGKPMMRFIGLVSWIL